MYFQHNNTLSSTSSPSICICQLYLSKVIFVLTQLIHNLADRSCSGVISQSYYRKKDILETASGGFRDDDDKTVLLSSFTFPGTWNLSRFKLKCWKYKVWFAVASFWLASFATNPNQPGSGNQEKNCRKHSTTCAAVVNKRTNGFWTRWLNWPLPKHFKRLNPSLLFPLNHQTVCACVFGLIYPLLLPFFGWIPIFVFLSTTIVFRWSPVFGTSFTPFQFLNINYYAEQEVDEVLACLLACRRIIALGQTGRVCGNKFAVQWKGASTSAAAAALY